jgi:hypothetical protein
MTTTIISLSILIIILLLILHFSSKFILDKLKMLRFIFNTLNETRIAHYRLYLIKSTILENIFKLCFQ